MKRFPALGYLSIVVLALSLPACQNSEVSHTNGHKNGGDGHNGHNGHEEEGHGAHKKGPNEGHIVELGDHKYLAEWVHDDENETIIIILHDHDSGEELALAAKVTIETALEQGAPKTFELAAENPSSDDPPKASRYSKAKDWELYSSVTSEKLRSTLIVEVDGQKYEAELEHHHH